MPEKEKTEKKDQIDITYDRRTKLHFEYEDSISVLADAYENKSNVFNKVVAGECDEQRLVEATVLLNYAFTRRMYCLMRLRREIDDELVEICRMMEENGFHIDCLEKEDDAR